MNYTNKTINRLFSWVDNNENKMLECSKLYCNLRIFMSRKRLINTEDVVLTRFLLRPTDVNTIPVQHVWPQGPPFLYGCRICPNVRLGIYSPLIYLQSL